MKALLQWIAKNAEKLGHDEMAWLKQYAQANQGLEKSWAVPRKLKDMVGVKERDYIDHMYQPEQMAAHTAVEGMRKNSPGRVKQYFDMDSRLGGDAVLMDEGIENAVKAGDGPWDDIGYEGADTLRRLFGSYEKPLDIYQKKK